MCARLRGSSRTRRTAERSHSESGAQHGPAAVDQALWDIKGKVAGLPVYQLLGGRSREGVTVYGHANGDTVDDVLREVATYVDLGYKAVRVQSGIPGLATTYGVGKDKMFYEPADAAIPSEAVWSTERYLSFVPSVFARVRDEGDEVGHGVPVSPSYVAAVSVKGNVGTPEQIRRPAVRWPLDAVSQLR